MEMIEGVWSWNVTERKLGNGNDCIGRNENRLDGKIRFCQQIKHFYANSGNFSFIHTSVISVRPQTSSMQKKAVFARQRGAKGDNLHRKWPHAIG